ncbi:MAG TPA: AAA family ATPase [Acidimicrobiales bacterium]
MHVAETHISWVFLVGDHAYKLKKPVRTAFLDFSTVDARAADCRREVELNRRLAADVYEGVATITGPDGKVCDHLVVMRRMPDDRRLASLVAGSATDAELRRQLVAVARRIAALHASSAPGAAIDEEASQQATAARWVANTSQLRPFAGHLVDGALINEVDALAARYVAGRGPLFTSRVAGARAVDGHGDMLADDIFCLDDGPRILDCLEFDDRLRWGDGLADAAFLAMDLERLGRPDLAELFLCCYADARGDAWPSSLAHHYVAYRAQVRAKVACLRSDQGGDTAQDARSLLDLALDRLRRGAVRIVLVGGLPGTGKSTLAAELASRTGWTLIRSDIVRKERYGSASRAPTGYRQGPYGPAQTEGTYADVLATAQTLAGLGESVVLDASWTAERHRAAAHEIANEAFADLVELRCVAPARVAAQRIQSRRRAGVDPSDATPAIAAAMAADAHPWPSSVALDSTMSIDDVVKAALEVAAPEATGG